MSRIPGRHRKRPRSPQAGDPDSRHRKPFPVTVALQHKPVRIAAAVAGSALIAAAAAPALTGAASGGSGSHAGALAVTGDGPLQASSQRGAGTGLLGTRTAALPAPPPATVPAGARRAKSSLRARRPHHARPARHHSAPAPPYRNPLRSVSGMIPERIDMGVDFGGSGPVYALGDAVITNATASSAGWPGGGWITYRLTGGPAAGHMVFLAEDVTPAVQVGDKVTSGTVIASMCDCGDGIETGWAQPDGSSAESQLPAAGGISGYGPFPTVIGLNFEKLLQALGVPAANNRGQSPSGILPPGYPADWARVRR